jgi:hypothetical protein
LPLSTRETVAIETPAASAISCKVPAIILIYPCDIVSYNSIAVKFNLKILIEFNCPVFVCRSIAVQGNPAIPLEASKDANVLAAKKTISAYNRY